MRRSHRLKKKKDFAQVYEAGRSAAGRLLVLYSLPSNCDTVRIGFAAGRKLGNAVVRNRAKRVLREVARKRLGVISSRYNLIIIARSNALKANASDLDKELLFLLKKLSLLIKG